MEDISAQEVSKTRTLERNARDARKALGKHRYRFQHGKREATTPQKIEELAPKGEGEMVVTIPEEEEGKIGTLERDTRDARKALGRHRYRFQHGKREATTPQKIGARKIEDKVEEEKIESREFRREGGVWGASGWRRHG